MPPFHNFSFVMMMTAFSSLAKTFGESSTVHSPPVLFCLLVAKRRSARVHQFDLLGHSKSTVAQQAEATGQVFPDESRVSSSLMCSHTMPGQQSQPTATFFFSRLYARLG